MKTLLTVVSAAALLSTCAFGETAAMNKEPAQVQSEVQNQFRTMSTDELLEKRGTITVQQDREQLHNELMSRQKSMTKEQTEKFMNKPESRVPKMNNQGSGQGMMQGQGQGSGMGSGSGSGSKGMGGGGMGGR